MTPSGQGTAAGRSRRGWAVLRRRGQASAAPAVPTPAAPTPSAPAAPPRRAWVGLSTTRRRWLFWTVVGAVSIGLFTVEVPLAVSIYHVPTAIVFILVAAHVAALPLAVWRPREASALSVAAALVLALVSTGGSHTAPWPWAVAPLITQALTLAMIAWKEVWWWALTAWAAGGVASVIAALVMFAREPLPASLTNIVVFANIALFTTAAAIVVRQLLRTRTQLAAERETSGSERARRQLADERARIARELHDVVAHGMSILNVQATSAPYRHPGLPEEVNAEFEQIAAQTRTTLAEMRRLLGVLRSEDGQTDPDLAPQPGLAELGALIEQARAAGAEILYQPGDALTQSVDDVVGLAAYRIVQEALSNALRHSPGATATVTARRDSRLLDLTIRNGPAPARPRRDTGSLAGAGFGLRGMRERATAVGGTVEYGPTPDGGYRVDAVLPVHAGGAS
ncbi:MAG TPA: histidine kinase [Gryllotalpicola sp.]